MTDRPSIMERVSVASNSGNLTLARDRRGDADWILALGIAGLRNGGTEAPLTRLHATASRVTLRTAVEKVERLVRRLNAKAGWKLAGSEVREVSEKALAHHIAPACQHCGGRRFELQENAPVLSGRACRHCHGTGRRPIQKKLREQIATVISALEEIDSRTESAVARLVR